MEQLKEQTLFAKFIMQTEFSRRGIPYTTLDILAVGMFMDNRGEHLVPSMYVFLRTLDDMANETHWFARWREGLPKRITTVPLGTVDKVTKSLNVFTELYK